MHEERIEKLRSQVERSAENEITNTGICFATCDSIQSGAFEDGFAINERRGCCGVSILATIICCFALWPFLAMWRAYCILILWGWFVLPATGIAAPSMYLLVGVLMTLGLMLPLNKPKEPKEGTDPFSNYMGNALAYGVCWPALVLLSGWIWRWLQWGIT